jgi:hypothetical protein
MSVLQKKMECALARTKQGACLMEAPPPTLKAMVVPPMLFVTRFGKRKSDCRRA